MPGSDHEQRHHHLRVLRDVTDRVTTPAAQALRVRELRTFYDNASAEFDYLIANLPGVFKPGQKTIWNTYPWQALESYAAAEGL